MSKYYVEVEASNTLRTGFYCIEGKDVGDVLQQLKTSKKLCSSEYAEIMITQLKEW